MVETGDTLPVLSVNGRLTSKVQQDWRRDGLDGLSYGANGSKKVKNVRQPHVINVKPKCKADIGFASFVIEDGTNPTPNEGPPPPWPEEPNEAKGSQTRRRQTR